MDFVILTEDLVEIVESVRTREVQVNCFSKFSKTKAGTNVTKSYHNSIITNLKSRQEHKMDKIKLLTLQE